MIGGLIATLSRTTWARTLLRYGVIGFAILLFLLTLRRSGERVGRLAKQLETAEKTHEAHRRMLEAAAHRPRSRDDLAQRLRDGRSDFGGLGACPPVVAYSRGFQARAAEELVLLPEDSAIAEMLSDDAVMREQARVCERS